MKKDKEWLRDEVSELYPGYDEMYVSPDYETVAKTETISKVLELIDQLDKSEVKQLDKKIKELESYNDELIRDNNQLRNQLDEPKKPVIPQFVAEWIESYRKGTLVELLNDAVYSVDEESKAFRRWFHEEKGFDSSYSEFLARVWLDGYEVEKEILWEIPIPFTVTSDGRIQYLIYDPKARTYLASRKNGQLKQTFNAKDLASVPTQYRHYAELCDFKKIEEVSG